MSSPRRTPSEIALKLLDRIDEKSEATGWDLIKVLGNTSQFLHWVEDFLMREGFMQERREYRNYFYRKTENGEMFHKLLKNGDIMQSLLQLSGKRLKNKSMIYLGNNSVIFYSWFYLTTTKCGLEHEYVEILTN